MYKINDTQIDFILNDISARGVEMESLQQNLLDHICCIVEQELDENGDFEQFYQHTIERFYKSDLWEIEEETLRLLTFKNYYTMKKIMLYSGAFSTAALCFGLIFKFMHWPGASVMITLGILIAGLIFLPITFTLRFKEKQNLRDKGIIVIGSISAILISFHVLFKVQHWPFANILGTISFFIVLLLFVPVYFFSGIRNPETKVNTIVSSFLILLGCGLILTMMRSPRSTKLQNQLLTESFIRNEQLIFKQGALDASAQDTLAIFKEINTKTSQLLNECYLLKCNILEAETGRRKIDSTCIRDGIMISDSPIKDYFLQDESAQKQLDRISNLLNEQSALCENSNIKINFQAYATSVKNIPEERVITALNTLTQIQFFALQNKRVLRKTIING